MLVLSNISEIELSKITGGGLGGDVAIGAMSGAYQVSQYCVYYGPQVYLACAAGGALVGGLIAYDLNRSRY